MKKRDKILLALGGGAIVVGIGIGIALGYQNQPPAPVFTLTDAVYDVSGLAPLLVIPSNVPTPAVVKGQLLTAIQTGGALAPLPGATIDIWWGLVNFQSQLSGPPQASVVTDSNGDYVASVTLLSPPGDVIGIVAGYNAPQGPAGPGTFGTFLRVIVA